MMGISCGCENVAGSWSPPHLFGFVIFCPDWDLALCAGETRECTEALSAKAPSKALPPPP